MTQKIKEEIPQYVLNEINGTAFKVFRNEIDNLAPNVDINRVLNTASESYLSDERERNMRDDPDSYEFWGATAAKLVKTPKTFFVPMPSNALFLSSSPDSYTLKKDEGKRGLTYVVATAIAIAKWCQENKLDKIFLKNASFSGKHRWPLTCNVDFKQSGKMSINDRAEKICIHMQRINEEATMMGIPACLGMVAREMLPTKPIFYAFGQMFYQFTDKTTGNGSVMTVSADNESIKIVESFSKSNTTRVMESQYHFGMPITRELRIFTFDGHVSAFIPYWPTKAFDNKAIYGLSAGMDMDAALKKINTFAPDELNHLRDQTTKLVSDPKLRKHDWAVDWLQTENGEWYMTDMQIAGHSFMDHKNAIFADEIGRNAVQTFLNQRFGNMGK